MFQAFFHGMAARADFAPQEGMQGCNGSSAGLNVRTFSISQKGVAFLPTTAFSGKCS